MDKDVGTDFRKAFFAEAADGKEIFNAAEWAALLAEAHDGLGGDGADGGKCLELLDGGGVQIERFFRGWRFLILRGDERKRREEQGSTDQNSNSYMH